MTVENPIELPEDFGGFEQISFQFDARIAEMLAEINDQREEICRAFIAKYSLDPDQCEQVIQNTGNTTTWFVRKRER